MTVLITLTSAGADSGPFNLYSDVDGYVSAFETGVSKSALLSGYTSSLVPNGTTIVRIKSTGICTNYIDVTVVTTTTTTTAAPIYDVYLADRYECGTCTVDSSGVLMALPTGTTPVVNDFYIPSVGSGEQGVYVYKLLSLSSGAGVICIDSHSSSCGVSCGV